MILSKRMKASVKPTHSLSLCSAQSHPTLETPQTACWAPLSMGFSRQEYWSGLSFHPPGDLPNPRIKPTSLASPALVE